MNHIWEIFNFFFFRQISIYLTIANYNHLNNLGYSWNLLIARNLQKNVRNVNILELIVSVGCIVLNGKKKKKKTMFPTEEIRTAIIWRITLEMSELFFRRDLELTISAVSREGARHASNASNASETASMRHFLQTGKSSLTPITSKLIRDFLRTATNFFTDSPT